MRKYEFTLPAKDGLPIGIAAQVPEDGGKKKAPVVLFLHGLKGFANWGSFPFISERICEAGFCVLTLDFSRNGVVNFESEITRIDLAEGNSISRQVAETGIVYAAVKGGKLADADKLEAAAVCVDAEKVFVLGHSMGGGTALRFAARHAELAGVVTWASIARLLGSWPQEMLDEFARAGRLNVPNARTGQDFYLGREFLQDIQTWGPMGILDAAREMKSPLLLMHGDADPAVPVASARDLYAAAVAGGNEKVELVIIPGADHNFGAVHPFKGTTEKLEAVIGKTVEWMQKPGVN